MCPEIGRVERYAAVCRSCATGCEVTSLIPVTPGPPSSGCWAWLWGVCTVRARGRDPSRYLCRVSRRLGFPLEVRGSEASGATTTSWTASPNRDASTAVAVSRMASTSLECPSQQRRAAPRRRPPRDARPCASTKTPNATTLPLAALAAAPDAFAHGPLDVARVVVATADDDDVLHATADEEPAAGHVAEVAGVQPRRVARPVAGHGPEGLRRELRLAEVALGDARPARDDLPDLPLAQARAGRRRRSRSRAPGRRRRSRRPRLAPAALRARSPTARRRCPRQRRAVDRVGPEALLQRRERDRERRLRHSVRRKEGPRIEARRRQRRRKLAQHAGLDRLRAAARHAQRRQIEVLQVLALQALGDEGVCEVRRVGDRAAMLVNLVEPEPRPPREARRGQENARARS